MSLFEIKVVSMARAYSKKIVEHCPNINGRNIDWSLNFGLDPPLRPQYCWCGSF